MDFTDDNFQTEVVNSTAPVLVDFWSLGCGPCRILKPIVEKVVSKHGNLKFGKCEASDAGDVFGDYKVNLVPTLVIFKGGKEVARKTGLMSEKELEDWLTANGV